jgi:hypothetical protein
LNKQAEELKGIAKAKKQRRAELAQLPFKKKIEYLVRLQKMAKGVKKSGTESRFIWGIEDD